MANFQDLNNSFVNSIADVFNSSVPREIEQQTGNFLVNQIVTRARRGFGVRDNGAQQQRFRPLSPEYVQQRREARRDGVLSSMTTPRRSNVTYTGQMLNSIFFESRKRPSIEESTYIQLYIGFNNDEAESKASELHNNGRPFLFITRSDINEVTRRISDTLGRILQQDFDRNFS